MRAQRLYIDKLLRELQLRGREDEVQLVQGLSNLLDEIADQAFDNYGILALMCTDLETIASYVARKAVPATVLGQLLGEVLHEEIMRLGDDQEALLNALVSRMDATKIRERILQKVVECNDPSSLAPDMSSMPAPDTTSITSSLTDG